MSFQTSTTPARLASCTNDEFTVWTHTRAQERLAQRGDWAYPQVCVRLRASHVRHNPLALSRVLRARPQAKLVQVKQALVGLTLEDIDATHDRTVWDMEPDFQMAVQVPFS
jgi:hypothetical protein